MSFLHASELPMAAKSATLVRRLRSAAPWVITFLALYLAFRGVQWGELTNHLRSASLSWLLLAISLTCLSYIIRSWRWQWLFPDRGISFPLSLSVLLLGFFMNNILPARTGEIVRAHLGSQVTGQRRTLVLATIVSERLADGLTISLMLVLFGMGVSNPSIRFELLLVAFAFALAGTLIATAIFFRARILGFAHSMRVRFDRPSAHYLVSRLEFFIDGLSPILSRHVTAWIVLGSCLVWSVELGVYYCVAMCFGVSLPLSHCVVFLVAVNFSSLIPAAPGGLGVIEAIASAVLVSLGMDKEHALTLVLTQHAIQYLVIGIPGAYLLATWKNQINKLRLDNHDTEKTSSVGDRGLD